MILNKELVEKAYALEKASEEYWDTYHKVYPKDSRPIVWLKNEETGHLMVMSPYMYWSQRILSFIKEL